MVLAVVALASVVMVSCGGEKKDEKKADEKAKQEQTQQEQNQQEQKIAERINRLWGDKYK